MTIYASLGEEALCHSLNEVLSLSLSLSLSLCAPPPPPSKQFSWHFILCYQAFLGALSPCLNTVTHNISLNMRIQSCHVICYSPCDSITLVLDHYFRFHHIPSLIYHFCGYFINYTSRSSFSRLWELQDVIVI